MIASVLFLLLLQFLSGDVAGKEISVDIDKFDQCPNDENSMVCFHNFKVNRAQNNVVKVFGTMIMKEPVHAKLKIELTIEKCSPAKTACITISTLHVDDICPEIPKKDRIWSDFMKTMNITKCPLAKGTYQVKDLEIDLDMLKQFFKDDAYWKITIKATSTRPNCKGVHVICVNIGAQVRVSSKNRFAREIEHSPNPAYTLLRNPANYHETLRNPDAIP